MLRSPSLRVSLLFYTCGGSSFPLDISYISPQFTFLGLLICNSLMESWVLHIHYRLSVLRLQCVLEQGPRPNICSWPPCPYITHIMIHHSLGQVLIRQGWEASLPDVGLNKFVRVASAPRPIPKANNTWLEKDSFLSQSLFCFKNLVLLLIHSLSLITIYLSLVTQTLLCKYK